MLRARKLPIFCGVVLVVTSAVWMHAAAQKPIPFGPGGYRLFTLSLLRSISLDLVVLAVSAVIILRLLSRLTLVLRCRRGLAGEAGSGVMEFVLLSPLLLTVLLVIFQVVLIVQAKFIVNYAAFCAVRSAAVVLPTSLQSTVTGKRDHFNQINPGDAESPKMAVIRRAAAIACAGISPRMGSVLGLFLWIHPGYSAGWRMAELGALYPGSVRDMNLADQMGERSLYSFAPEVTRVEVKVEPHPAPGPMDTSYGMITVRVVYRYFLTVPFANRLLGTGFQRWFSSYYYISINEEYTLPTEMDPIFPMDQEPDEQWEYETFE